MRLVQHAGPRQNSARGPSGSQRAPISRVNVVCALTGAVPDARVVVIGGTGRVGSSTASALIKEFPNLKVTLASRSEDSYQAALARRPELSKASFQRVDITSADSVKVRIVTFATTLHL